MAKKKIHASRRAAGKVSKKKKHAKPASKARKAPASSTSLLAGPTALAYVQWVHATLDKLIASFPPDKATYQVAGTDNHLLWTVGHLATTYAWLAMLLDGQAPNLPEGYSALFGYQSKPSGDTSGYPSLDEVKREYARTYQRFCDVAARQSAADLAKPPAADSFGFATTRLDVLLRAGWHDGWHSGQLSTLRRALGLPPIM